MLPQITLNYLFSDTILTIRKEFHAVHIAVAVQTTLLDKLERSILLPSAENVDA